MRFVATYKLAVMTSSRVYEEVADFHVEVVEYLPVAKGDACYPLPRLRPTGRIETRTYGVVVLENEFLRVKILPDLGGRILSLFDKRSGDPEPVRDMLVVQAGEPRGVGVPEGIEIQLTCDARPNSMGSVSFQTETPEDEEDAAGIWIGEASFHDGLSFNAYFSLPPGELGLRIEVRVVNRTFEPKRYNAGVRLGLSDVVVAPEPGTFLDGGTFRFAEDRDLGPRQADTWAVRLLPMATVVGASGNGIAISFDPSGQAPVRAQAAFPVSGHKLVLLTEDAKTLEAPVELGPDRPVEIPLEGIRPIAMALLDSEGNEVLRTDRRAEPLVHHPIPTFDPDADLATLTRFTYVSALRGPAHAAIGRYWMRKGEFVRAAESFETALLYNGDDPLTWWALAASRRLAGQDDGGALLNAHFLSPLEPMLRAEAFLSQGMEMPKEKHPLVEPVAEIPEDLVEVACVLIEHGLLEQASRWLDEALRHHNLAMLHYLMAFILLQGTRMDAEAAQHVALAAKAQLPPMPWRQVEVRALRVLAERFPVEAIASLVAALPHP